MRMRFPMLLFPIGVETEMNPSVAGWKWRLYRRPMFHYASNVPAQPDDHVSNILHCEHLTFNFHEYVYSGRAMRP